MYSFPDLEPVFCSMFSSNCCFLTFIQISQKLWGCKESNMTEWPTLSFYYKRVLQTSSNVLSLYHLKPVRMSIIKKSTNNKCWRGCGEKRNFCTVDGNVNRYRHYRSWLECKLMQAQWRFLKKLGIKPPYDRSIPLLGIYPGGIKIGKDACIPMFIAALFTIIRTCKQLDVHQQMNG